MKPATLQTEPSASTQFRKAVFGGFQMPIMVRLGIAIFPLVFVVSAFAGLRVGRLRCEYLENPLGIDVRQPRLNWILDSGERGQKQTAYQILVASRADELKNDRGDLWDSGKISSDQTT